MGLAVCKGRIGFECLLELGQWRCVLVESLINVMHL